MSIIKNPEQPVPVETGEREKSSPEAENHPDSLDPFESVQLAVETIANDVSSFEHAAKKLESFSWVETTTKEQDDIELLKEAATQSIGEFDKQAKQLTESIMKKLEAEVLQERASSEAVESTEDRLFDRTLFIKEYNQLKKTVGEGGRNIGLYRFKDKFVKLVRSRRSMNQEQLSRLKDETKDLENVFVPDEIIDLDTTKRAFIMPLAEWVI
ncbi:MAG: hypothetical protein AAB664_03495 [Patescibacteria group bacterium]